MTRSSSGQTPARPPAFVVGAQCASRPLVSPEQVMGHLRLLRMFYNLRITVEDGKDRRIPAYAMQMDKVARWRWFVHLAVERFELWLQSLQFVTLEKFITGHIPPVDVWMVWHAYLLNPCWYAEDCERLPMLQQLQLLNVFVVSSINLGKVVQRKASTERAAAWHRETGTPFNPFEAMTVRENMLKQLECPRCRTRVYALFANDDGTGYAEGKFLVMCPLPGCRLRITHDSLAVAKFVRDLSEGNEAQDHFVAGSLFSPSGKRDIHHAKVIRDQLMQSGCFAELRLFPLDERLARLDRVKEIKEKIGYTLPRLKEAISTSLKDCSEASVTRILSAYTCGSPFSINLVDAVLRQCRFTEQMDELEWLKPGTFHDEDKREILEHSITRYHAFLDLMTAHPSSILVPTLDIDLVWHTHQLMASRYGIDCEMYVGRYVDHELCVAESRLASAFSDTCRAWQERFQVLYMQCGCPVPDETSMHKFVRLFRHRLRGRSQLQVDLHPEHLPATHPSAHNALLTFQTVCTGTFSKTHHHTSGKREAERSRSRSPHRERTLRQPERRSLSRADRTQPSMDSPGMLDLSPAPPSPSPYGRSGSDWRYVQGV